MSPDAPARRSGAGRRAPLLDEAYARWRSSRLGRITDHLERQRLAELLGPVAGKSLLDVGCGDGGWSVALAREGAAVTGLDADPRMLAAARKRADAQSVRLRLVNGDVRKLPFDEASFDLVLAVTVLCFVQDAQAAIGEMARVLKPGGRLVLGELGRWSLWAAQRRMRGWLGDPVWHAAKFRTAADLRNLVRSASLSVTATRGAVFYPPCALAAQLLAPLDGWLRGATFGATFIALSAVKRDHTERPRDDSRRGPAGPVCRHVE